MNIATCSDLFISFWVVSPNCPKLKTHKNTYKHLHLISWKCPGHGNVHINEIDWDSIQNIENTMEGKTIDKSWYIRVLESSCHLGNLSGMNSRIDKAASSR